MVPGRGAGRAGRGYGAFQALQHGPPLAHVGNLGRPRELLESGAVREHDERMAAMEATEMERRQKRDRLLQKQQEKTDQLQALVVAAMKAGDDDDE